MEYPVYKDLDPIGKVLMVQDGLYATISCKCQIKDEKICRLGMFGDSGYVDLGVCVPINNHYCVNTKIALKYIPKGELRFEICDGKRSADTRMIQISSDGPCEALEYLSSARVEYIKGVPYLVISD